MTDITKLISFDEQPDGSVAVNPLPVHRVASRRARTAMTEAVAALQNYWATYDKQQGYEDYSMTTLIDDALYGLGIAIDKNQFQCGSGYDKFKAILREHLGD